MDIIKLLGELYEPAYMVDEDRRIVFWNNQAEIVTGYKSEEIIGRFCYDNILRHVSTSGQRLCHKGCPLQDSIKNKKVNESQVFLHHKRGFRVPVKVRTIPFYDDVDKKYKAIEVFTDYRDEKSLYLENKELQEKVITDDLTGIYNRAFIDYQIDTCIHEFNVFNISFGVLFIDIDHFKKVNDTFGHDVGDKVLVAVTQTIKVNIRMEDYVGRYGGEEFVVILRNISKENLYNTAEKLRMLIEGLDVETKRGKLGVTVSIGCSHYGETLSKEEIVRRADELMYKAKNAGRNKVFI
jgi:diguanylate cyclase (GGDEF)-like protein/PAS domain S-box-containing protein